MYREGLPSRYLGRPLMDVVTMYNSYDATDIIVNPSFLRHFVIKKIPFSFKDECVLGIQI